MSYFMLLSMFMGVTSQVMKAPANPRPSQPQADKPLWMETPKRTNTHQPPPPITTPSAQWPQLYWWDPLPLKTRSPHGSPHSRKESELMRHDACACCAARFLFGCSLKLWSVCAILISLGVSFHILLLANAIVFWKFGFPLWWINYYYWQILCCMSVNSLTFKLGYQLVQDASCLTLCKQKLVVSKWIRFFTLTQPNSVKSSP